MRGLVPMPSGHRISSFALFVSIVFCLSLQAGLANGRNAVPSSREASHRLAAYFTQCYQRQQFHGVVLVRREGQTLYRKGFGEANIEWKMPNRPDGRFELGSLTKQFAGVLALTLRDENRLDFQSPISRYLPELRDAAAGKVTMQQLLTHTAGIPSNLFLWDHANDLSQDYSAAAVLQDAKAWKLDFAPGERFAYSNTGFLLARVVLETVSGLPFAALLQQRILTPLGMTQTGVLSLSSPVARRAAGYERNFDNALQPVPRINLEWALAAAGLYSSADDLARWAEALQSGHLLSPQSRRDLFTPQVNGNYSYGLGVRTLTLKNPERVVTVCSHTGRLGGFCTSLTWTSDGMTIVLLNNTDSETDVSELAKQVRYLLSGDPYQFPRRSLAHELARVASRQGWSKSFALLKTAGRNSKQFAIVEEEFNALGYFLLRKGDSHAAIAAFAINVETFPNSANARDSLGEAYAKQGERERAIACYEKVLQLDPASENAKKMLAELHQLK